MDKFFKAIAGIKLGRAGFMKLAVFCFVVSVGVLLFFSTTYALVDEVRNGIMGILIDWFISFGEFCIKMTVFFLYFFIQLAKYNNYLDVPTVQLGWTMVRDVANMFFVVVLLMISIGTILGLEQYQWNKTLVKLILAAVFINFSNLICGIFIDIAHVFTITFVNAVASTAGGNLIQMFSLNKMYDLILNQPIDAAGKFDVRILVGAVSAFLFAFLAMVTMFAYLVVMVARVVVLWVLIILSPLAFIMQVIPQTQAYAKEWWDKFGKQVAVAPVIVFFLWLAFATAGQGNLATVGMELKMEPLNQELGKYVTSQTGQGEKDKNPAPTSITWSSVTTWESMSNFLISMALLFVGIGVVSKMGVVGGGMVSKATDLFKNVATIATGYAAGRYLGRKGWEVGKKAVFGAAKLGLTYMPLGGDWWKDRGKWLASAGKIAWYRGVAQGDIPGHEKTGRALGFIGKWTGLRGMANRTARRKKRLRAMEGAAESSEKIISKEQSSKYAGNLGRNLKGALEGMEMRSKVRDQSGIDYASALQLEKMRIKDNKPTGMTWAQEAAKYTTEAAEAAKAKETPITRERRKNREKATEELREKGKQVKGLRDLEKSKEELVIEVRLSELKHDIDDAQTELVGKEQETLSADRMIHNRTMAENQGEIDKLSLERMKAMNKAMVDPTLAGDRERTSTLELQRAEWTKERDKAKNEEDKQAAQDEINVIDIELEGLKPEDVAKLDEQIKVATEKKKETEETWRAKEQKVQQGMQLVLRTDSNYVALKTEEEKLKKDMVTARKARTQEDGYEEKRDQHNLAAAYIEGGDEKLRATLLKQNPELSQNELEKKEEELKEEYKAKGYTAGFQTGGAKAVLAEMVFKGEETGLKAAEAEARQEMLGLEGAREIFDKTQVYETFAEAADKFVDKIKQIKLQDIFDGGLKNMKKEEELQKKLSVLGRDTRREKDPQKKSEKQVEAERLRESIKDLQKSAGAKLVRAEVAQGYEQELAGISRQEAKDKADDEFSLERYGHNTPASAFKSLIKKKMEEFGGMEREQAVEQALNDIAHLNTLRESGETLTRDQEAMLMAGTTYLTKQAWSDDLLARIVSKIKMGQSGQLSGKDREQADGLKKVFIDELKWGRENQATGEIEIDKLTNESSNIRTNQMHRMIGYAGDYGLVQAEDAVLKHMNTAGLGYSKATENLAQQVLNIIPALKKDGLSEADINVQLEGGDFKNLAKNLGFKDDKEMNNLRSFVRRFVATGKSATAAMEGFKEEVKSHFEANQMLADAKNMALAVGHLDDGGHTYFDMDEGIFRGQTASQAMQFILSDWRKLGVDERARRLKVHSVAQMNEDSQTIAVTVNNADAIRETFQNLDTNLNMNRVDGRTQDQIAGLAAGEKAIIDSKTGSMVVGGEDSVMQKKTFSSILDATERETKALAQIADNWAVFINEAPIVLAAACGKRSNVEFDDAKTGIFNLQLPNGEKIIGYEQMLKFIEDHRSDVSKQTVVINHVQVARAFESNKSKKGQQGKKKKQKEKEEEQED